MATIGLICSHCGDISDLITPLNGRTLLASTSEGDLIIALHPRCEEHWANKNNCRSLVPLRKLIRRSFDTHPNPRHV